MKIINKENLKMRQLINQLSSIDRKAALIFNREIKLRLKRGELEFDPETTPAVEDSGNRLMKLIDSFNWERTRQGHRFWDAVWDKVYAESWATHKAPHY